MSHWPADDAEDDGPKHHEFVRATSQSGYFLPCGYIDPMGRKCNKAFSHDLHRKEQPRCGWCWAVEGSQGACTCKTRCLASKCPKTEDNLSLYWYNDNVPVPRFRKEGDSALP